MKKIIDIEWKRSCFCGKPLIKGFCEIHGSEIKTASYLIHAQFEEVNTKKITPINLSLTQNQFLNLFPKKELDNFFINHEEFEVSISQFGTVQDIESVVDYFFNQLESDSFYNNNRLRDVQITDSGITIHFLYDFEIITQNKLNIQFNTLALRSLDNYIKWRLNRFKAKPDNIINSLLGIRKNVFDENGQAYRISNVKWNSLDSLPESIEVQNKQETMIFTPQKLYHGQENLQLFTKLENRIHKALRNFSQQFTYSLKQYLISQSCLAKIQKVSQFNLTVLNRFIGKTIKNSINLNELSN
ncbi:MAG: hypothetical protein FK733_13340 [Asgard group archaeon]|nr:hypothetical protein [Asgard group archaeon]